LVKFEAVSGISFHDLWVQSCHQYYLQYT